MFYPECTKSSLSQKKENIRLMKLIYTISTLIKMVILKVFILQVHKILLETPSLFCQLM